MVTAPRTVFQACWRGLASYQRAKISGVEDALKFANHVANNKPINVGMASQAAEAHFLIAKREVENGGPDRLSELMFLLWGGPDAAGWCDGIVDRAYAVPPLEPEPTVPLVMESDVKSEWVEQPIAAEAAPVSLAGLENDLFTIDETTITALEAAFWIAYRTALRRSSASIQAASNRISKTVQAEVGFEGNDLNEARNRMSAAAPYGAWAAADARIFAAIDLELERTLEGTLDDYEETAYTILRDGVLRAAGVVASALGVSRRDAEDRAPTDDRLRDAARFSRAALLEWVRARLAGDRAPEDLGELDVPPGVFRDTIGVAGGAVTAGAGLARDESGVAVGAGGGLVAESLGGSIVDRVGSDGIGSVLAGAVVGTEFEWVYGARSERGTPFEPHYELRDTRWGPGDPVPEYSPGDHNGCRCRLKRRWVLT